MSHVRHACVAAGDGVMGNPAIGADGTVYIGSNDGYVRGSEQLCFWVDAGEWLPGEWSPGLELGGGVGG